MKEKPIKNSYWVTPQFCAGRYPGNVHRARRIEYVGNLEASGISLFIDLTEEGELETYAEVLKDAKHVRMPIRDFSVTTTENYRMILDRIDAAIADDQAVYVHCWGGIGRTGTIVGCWLVRHGMAPQAALDQIKEWRKDNPNRYKPSPETEEQRQIVLGWRRGQ